MFSFLRSYFNFKEAQTSFKKETLGAITTFSSIAYVMAVNPTILADAHMNLGSVLIATILMTFLATLLMGLLTNYPFVIAPGLGVSAYFTYSIVLKNNIPWEKGFVALFCVGLCLLLLTVFKLRKKILSSIPPTLSKAIICGIGAFLFFVGLSQIGIIEASHGTFITFGKLFQLKTLTTALSFIFIIFLLQKNQPYAFILVIFLNWIGALIFKEVKYEGIVQAPPSLWPTFFQLNFQAIFDLEFYKYFFSLFLVSLFDSTAGLMILLKQGKFLDNKGKSQHLQRALFPDSITSTVAPLIGTSTMAIHIESLSGMKAGSKTGFSSVLVAFFFLCCLFFYPLFSTIPESAIAPVLMVLGCYMMMDIKGLNWKNLPDVISFFIIVFVMPLTFSIYLGFALGFISYTFLKIITGQFKQIPLICYIFSVLFLIELVCL